MLVKVHHFDHGIAGSLVVGKGDTQIGVMLLDWESTKPCLSSKLPLFNILMDNESDATT